jgi:hypothetical protein
MLLRVNSIFPASIENIYEKIKKISTLQFIAAPYAYFEQIDTKNLSWQAGETSEYFLFIFKFINIGIHTIKVIQFDTNEIYTKEYNKSIPIWNHKIKMKKLNDYKTLYSDEVEIKAGIKTFFIYIWALLFYNHRQRKWKKLLQNSKEK